MKLSPDARWLLDYVDGASRGADGRMLEAGSRAKALQGLIDKKLVHADEKGRYRLTEKGKELV